MKNISKEKRDNLSRGFHLFIESMRDYIIKLLQQEAGEQWPAWFTEALHYSQRESWNTNLRNGTAVEKLIDYTHLKPFALKYKQLLKKDFKRETNRLPTYFDTITEIRNKYAHYNDITEDEYTEVFIKMKKIAYSIKDKDLAKVLDRLQKNNKPQTNINDAPAVVEPKAVKTSEPIAEKEIEAIKQTKVFANHTSLQAWFNVVEPHEDIVENVINESTFAANLGNVAKDIGRLMYQDAETFFSQTYFTTGIKHIAQTVIKGLNGDKDTNNTVISLQTNFGGGKTHTLISLYHLAKHGKGLIQSPHLNELLEYTGNPNFASANVAVFTNSTLDAANGRMTSEGIKIQTIWGELAYQLGGLEAYKIIQKNDEQCITPSGLFQKVLTQCSPCLILIDELADYCVRAAGKIVGETSLANMTISFMQELTEAVAATKHCVAVITLPASIEEVEHIDPTQARSILNSLQKRVSRISSNQTPVSDEEVFEVIRRRLFKNIGDEYVRKAVVAQYMDMYQKHSNDLAKSTRSMEYKKRLLQSYPFHPELIDTFRLRWASHHKFQRTRGVLRLLGAIVNNLWQRKFSLPSTNWLIHSGSFNLADITAIGSTITELYGNGYQAVFTADVYGNASNARKIDKKKKEYNDIHLTESLAAVILMNSFGIEGANKGISISELKLHLLSPKGFNANYINSILDDLEDKAYYLHYTQIGGQQKRYWFHVKPNINILINQARNDIKLDAIHSEILHRINKQAKQISRFHCIVSPLADISEQKKLTLVILSPKYAAKNYQLDDNIKNVIEKIATKKGNSERIYRNTILFLLCNEKGLSTLESNLRDYLACQKIEKEYQSQLEKEQKNDIANRKKIAFQNAETNLAVAYSIVARYVSEKEAGQKVQSSIKTLPLHSFKDTLQSQINEQLLETLEDAEWVLNSLGYGFLREYNLLPTAEHHIQVKDLYEAFLRFNDKSMITGRQAVSKSLLRYCEKGRFCIAVGDGTNFTDYYLKEDVPKFDVTDESFWLLVPEKKPQPQAKEETKNVTSVYEQGRQQGIVTQVGEEAVQTQTFVSAKAAKAIRGITINGSISPEQYTDLFRSFILPFINEHDIKISVRFEMQSKSSQISLEQKELYEKAKEAAKQMYLVYEELK